VNQHTLKMAYSFQYYDSARSRPYELEELYLQPISDISRTILLKTDKFENTIVYKKPYKEITSLLPTLYMRGYINSYFVQF
jgi:hypothetical protein